MPRYSLCLREPPLHALAGPFCKRCGYSLAGLAAGKCPECARPFDPAVPETIDRVPRRTRRRRLIRRAAILVALLIAAAALFPRGYAQGNLILTHADGTATEFSRIQPIAPRWLRRWVNVRYPGWTRSHATSPPPASKAITFESRGYAFTFRGRESMGSSSAWGSLAEATVLTINGLPATATNADAIFESVVPNIAAERSFGVSVGTALTTAPASDPGNR